MKATLLSLHAGQTGCLYFDITGGDPSGLTGGVLVDGRRVLMQPGTTYGTLLIPPVAVGCHQYEIRCNGRTVLHGELDVLPSALDNYTGTEDWHVDVDLTQPLVVVEVHFSGGGGGGASIVIDQDYNPTSSNAASGRAIAQALASISGSSGGSSNPGGGGGDTCHCVIDQDYNPTSSNAASGRAIAQALASISSSNPGGGGSTCHCVVDQSFSPNSTNAASGRAVKEATDMAIAAALAGVSNINGLIEGIAEALMPVLSCEFGFEGPTASYNANADYIQLGSFYFQGSLVLLRFGWRVRFDNLNGCYTEPAYLGVWEQAADGVSWEKIGVSTNTQTQALSSDLSWDFPENQVRLHGRPIRFVLLEHPEDEWRCDLRIAVRTSTTTDPETTIFLNNQFYDAVPKFFMRGKKGPEKVIIGGEDGGAADGIGIASSYDPEDNRLAITGRVLAEALQNFTPDTSGCLSLVECPTADAVPPPEQQEPGVLYGVIDN